MPELAVLGWDAAREAEFKSPRDAGLVPGRVSLEHNHVYRVFHAGGEILAEAAGRLKHRAAGRRELPAVGDWVGVRIEPAGERATIRAMLARRTTVSRRAAGRTTAEQVLAANVDIVFVVFGLDKPVNARAIERYLAVVRPGGAMPVVVLNKADLCDAPAGAEAEAAAAAGPSPVHAVTTRAPGGASALERYLTTGRTVALLGPSGAGKSSLVNALLGEDMLRTGEVRDWDQRGRHTSVHRQMVIRPAGGLIVDTPGMRELQLWDSEQGLEEGFREIAELAAACRFRDCRHDTEPGCAVKAAVGTGALDADRYDNYTKIRQEHEALEKARAERELAASRKGSRTKKP